MLKSFNLDKTYHFLLVLLALFLPLTVFGGNLVIVLICLIWIISGDYKTKISQIMKSKLLIASIIFYCIHLAGLLWTEDLEWGLHIAHKMWYFVGLFPILYTIVRKENISKYISAFLIAISFTEICSYLIWFEIVEPFKNATVENPIPFMSHVSYNPILTFAIYLVLHELFFNKKLSHFMYTLYLFFAATMSINMFITGGRAGQVAFFFMLVILIFQIFDKKRIKAFFTAIIIIPIIFFASYQTSPIFHDRVNSAISEVLQFHETKGYDEASGAHTSVGARIGFALNSWEIIKNNLLFGVGTGDFPKEYKKINQINSPKLPNTTNPHNMYTLILVQLGLVGLASMISIFYYQIKIALNSTNRLYSNAGLTLPLIFLVMMLSDSYLLGHYTTLMFIFFSSFLYKNFDNS